MKKIPGILLVLMLLSSCTESFYIGKINQRDKEGKKKGLWVSWWDDDQSIPMSKYWYRDGKELWRTKTSNNNGNISVKFKKRGERLKVKYFDSYGNLSHKGWARFDVNEEDIHYYWDGEWKYFDEKHRLIKKVLYENGEEKDTMVIKVKADQID